MAKVSFLDIPAGFDFAYSQAVTVSDRFSIPRVRRHKYFTTRKSKKGLTLKSLLPEVASAWNSLTQADRELWETAGALMSLTGYKLFTKDKVLRIKNDLVGVAVPSVLHQTLIGAINISSPAKNIHLTQLHPAQYWVSRVVRLSGGLREPVLVTESFDLPLKLKISYKSNLVSAGLNPRGCFYAIIYSKYQGLTRETVLSIDFDFVADWKSAEVSLDWVIGEPFSYALFIKLDDLIGDLYFDNIVAEHSAQNWCRDPFCNDIDQSFTKAFYQVPKHWVPVDIPVGAFFGSVYN